MKRLLTLLLCLLLLANCRSTKEINRVTTTTQDSTTTVTQRHISLVLSPDSLRDSMSVQAFTDSFRVDKVGQVFKRKASKGVKYTLRKTSTHDFEVEVHAAAKDTTVTLADTLTRVHTKMLTTVTLEKQPTILLKAWEGIKNAILWLLLLLVLLSGSLLAWRTYRN